jgi:hypothetical protein
VNLPDNYRFTEQDVDSAWDLFANHYLTATEEQLYFMDMAFYASDMYEKSGTYPTLAEADAYGWAQEDARWQKRYKCNAPRERIEYDWVALLEKSAQRERDEKK